MSSAVYLAFPAVPTGGMNRLFQPTEHLIKQAVGRGVIMTVAFHPVARLSPRAIRTHRPWLLE